MESVGKQMDLPIVTDEEVQGSDQIAVQSKEEKANQVQIQQSDATTVVHHLKL